MAVLVGGEEALEGVARGGVDGDAVLAVGQGGDVDGVVAAVDLGGDHHVERDERHDLDIIVIDFSRAVDNDGLRHIIIIHVGHVGRDDVKVIVSPLMMQINCSSLILGRHSQNHTS